MNSNPKRRQWKNSGTEGTDPLALLECLTTKEFIFSHRPKTLVSFNVIQSMKQLEHINSFIVSYHRVPYFF
jgi:hypothetical protein